MSTTELTLVSQLISDLLEKYESVEELVHSFGKYENGDDQLKHLELVNFELERIKIIEAEVTSKRKQLAADNIELPVVDRERLDKVIGIVTRLIPALGDHESRARDSREQLMPQIHEGVRALQMQNAYANGSRSANSQS